jgi:hypothetical protein
MRHKPGGLAFTLPEIVLTAFENDSHGVHAANHLPNDLN